MCAYLVSMGYDIKELNGRVLELENRNISIENIYPTETIYITEIYNETYNDTELREIISSLNYEIEEIIDDIEEEQEVFVMGGTLF